MIIVVPIRELGRFIQPMPERSQAGQEYLIPMEEDLTVSHSVPVQRSPCFFEVFFADEPNA
jgi:hypothetical protein